MAFELFLVGMEDSKDAQAKCCKTKNLDRVRSVCDCNSRLSYMSRFAVDIYGVNIASPIEKYNNLSKRSWE